MEHIALIDENIPLLAESLLDCCHVIKFTGRKLGNRQILDSEANILFIRSVTKINQDILKNTKIKLIGTATSGTDHIDLDYLKEKNIHFAFAPGSNANSVAEYIVYSILKWANQTNLDINGKTIGIIGFGNIGSIVARYSHCLGLTVLINDPPLRDDGYVFREYSKFAELNEICRKADIITNHVPLTKDGKYPTYHLINSDFINNILDGALFIHASRGGVVEESPLLERLKNKTLFASIDVWENEPLINADLPKESIIATPHIAGYSYDGKIRGAFMMAEAFRQFTGLVPDLDMINKELLSYIPIVFENFKNPEKFYEKLKESRCFDDDTQNLLSTLNFPSKERAMTFDKLRKEYPLRREIL